MVIDDTFTPDETANFLADSLAALDHESIAIASNLITGGCLRADDAAKVVRMVADGAIRTPGREVIVAGIRAIHAFGKLHVGISGNLETLEL